VLVYVPSARPVPCHPVSDDESELDELEANRVTYGSPV